MTYQEAALEAVSSAARQYQQQTGRSASGLGYLRVGRHQRVFLFEEPSQAQGWWSALPSVPYDYAALYDGRNLAAPISETFGTAISSATTVGDFAGRSIEDIRRVVRQIDTAFTQIVSELYTKMGADPKLLFELIYLHPRDWPSYVAAQSAILRSPLFPLWRDTVAPIWADWNSFFEDHKQGSWGEHTTDWIEYENWGSRVVRLHDYLASEIPKLAPTVRLDMPTPFIGAYPWQSLWTERRPPYPSLRGPVGADPWRRR